MSSDNPFAPPGAELREVDEAPVELASRLSRFVAAVIDGLVFVPFLYPLFSAFGVFEGFPDVEPLSPARQIGLGLVSIPLYLAPHLYLLATRGQTIGKWLLRIRITRTDGETADIGRLLGLRYLPFLFLSVTPGIGSLVSIVDDLFIFSESRRCLHDRLADTIVVRV